MRFNINNTWQYKQKMQYGSQYIINEKGEIIVGKRILTKK